MELRTFSASIFSRTLICVCYRISKPFTGRILPAAIKGSSNPHILLEIDPHGAPMVAPEEVRLGIWNDWGWSWPAAFHSRRAICSKHSQQPRGKRGVHPSIMKTWILDRKKRFLTGLATVHLHALTDGVVVVPLTLFPTLRVSKVEGEHGEVLDYIQEKKEEDSDFALVLPMR